MIPSLRIDQLLAALDLPEGARVDQRVPKKLLVENGAPTAADKRHINEGIEAFQWLAALKPTTIGVPEFRDDLREYLEIAVLSLMLRAGGKTTRLAELVHRAVPYPVFLILKQGNNLIVSLAHKRWAQNKAGKMVLEGEIVEAELASHTQNPAEIERQCLSAFSLSRQPRTHLLDLYQGWYDTLLALNAARVTGVFILSSNTEQATARRQALIECSRLDADIAKLRAAASKEKQIARQVELNLKLKSMEAALSAARARL